MVLPKLGTEILNFKLPLWPCERARGSVTRNIIGLWVLKALGMLVVSSVAVAECLTSMQVVLGSSPL